MARGGKKDCCPIKWKCVWRLNLETVHGVVEITPAGGRTCYSTGSLSSLSYLSVYNNIHDHRVRTVSSKIPEASQKEPLREAVISNGGLCIFQEMPSDVRGMTGELC